MTEQKHRDSLKSHEIFLWDNPRVQEAARRYNLEGEKGIGWVEQWLSAAERVSFEKDLTAAQHPLAYQAGSFGHRFAVVVREPAAIIRIGHDSR